ncbi:MAG: HEAT repeat domain-containing protein, partial [Halothiobacillus sp.]|nr:HEAT repeat domain-containing protein [Halothiobacillus sp.]
MNELANQNEEVTELLARLIDPDPGVRRIAVLDLLDTDDYDLVAPALLQALGDGDASVRAEAAIALEGFETPPIIQGLLRALKDEYPEVTKAAAQSLAELKLPASGALLIVELGTAKGFEKAAIFRALRELRVPASLDPALAALDDPDETVRA